MFLLLLFSKISSVILFVSRLYLVSCFMFCVVFFFFFAYVGYCFAFLVCVVIIIINWSCCSIC